jgi:Fe-S-cluster containining protein
MIEHSVAKCLSFHASYQCRRSGVCCSAGWTIPFDGADLETLRALPLARGTIDTSGRRAVARMDAGGRCSFLDRDAGTYACEIHRTGGHAALPLPCRMFPRQVLHDGRGTFISLSHFCPTAVGLLFDDEPVSIVEAPHGLIGDGTLDGLDARDAWPPVLRPGLMMDLESFARWEGLAVELLTRPGVTADAALAGLSDATTAITAWTPSAGSDLSRVVGDAFGALRVVAADRLPPHEHALKRWLAARLFGSWIAYQGDALRTIVRYVRACRDVFDAELARDRNPREAIRRSDRLIVHESSSQQMATLLNDCP